MKRIFEFTLLFAFFLFNSGFVYAGGQDETLGLEIAGNETIRSFGGGNNLSGASKFSRNLIKFIYGKPIKDGLIYMPFGIHINSGNNNVSNNALLGIAYKSFIFGTFMNSFGDRTWYIVKGRNIISYKRFGVDYYFGLMYGYKGKLSTSEGTPFRNTFLFAGNLNPTFTIAAHYSISDHVQIQTMLSPAAYLFGVKYNF
jgi:hypothetical protein